MNCELALLFADLAAMAGVALVFWLTQSLRLTVAVTALLTVGTCVVWDRWVGNETG